LGGWEVGRLGEQLMALAVWHVVGPITLSTSLVGVEDQPRLTADLLPSCSGALAEALFAGPF